MEKLLLMLAASSLLASGLELPSNIQTCRRSSDDLDECLKGAIQDALPKLAKGLPQFHLATLEPILIPEIVMTGGSKGVVYVDQRMNNFQLSNLTRAKILRVHATVQPKEFALTIDAVIPEAIWISHYNITGKILVLPIAGDGELTLKLNDLMINVTMSGQAAEKKGKPTVELTNFALKLAPGSAVTRMENLFGGDEQLSDQMHKLINENWKELWADVKSNYEKVLGMLIKNHIDPFFNKLSLEQVFPL